MSATHAIPVDTARTLARIKDVHEKGATRVRFTGGEPLLHPELARILRFSTDLGLRTSVVTNGSLLQDRLGVLIDCGVGDIWISLYGINTAEYAKVALRNPPVLAISSAVSEMRDLDLATGIYCPVDLESVSGDFSLLEALVRAGARRVKFIQLMPQGRWKTPWSSAGDLWQRGFKFVDSFARRHRALRIQLSIRSGDRARMLDAGWKVPVDLSCKAATPDNWAVAYDGQLHACCLSLGSSSGPVSGPEVPIRFFPASGRRFPSSECYAVPGLASDTGEFACPLSYAEMRHE